MFWAGSGRWKDAYQHEAYNQDDGGCAATLAREGPRYTSSRKHQESSGAAPCADGLAWGFHGEDSREGKTHSRKDSVIDKLGAKSLVMNSRQGLRDEEGVLDFAPVSSTDTVRCSAIGFSPQSSVTSGASLAMLAYRSGLSQEGGKQEEHLPQTFSSIDESLEQEEEELSPKTDDHACEFSSFHLVDVGGFGTAKQRQTRQQQEQKSDHEYHLDNTYENGDTEHLVPFSVLQEPILLAPCIPDDGSNVGTEGLQGLSPGPGQDIYAAKFRSPCPKSLQNPESVIAAERSMGSIFDATSPSSWAEGGMKNSPFLSPRALSINTASSLCQGGKGEPTCLRTPVDVWDKDAETEDEEVEGEERKQQVQEEKAGEYQEGKQDDGDEMGGEVCEAKQQVEGRTPGVSKDEEQDPTGERSSGNRKGRQHHASAPQEEGIRAGIDLFAAAATAEDVGQGSPASGHGKGSATSLVLGMNVKANKGVMPASDASGESWDADDTPRLDDYFRGQATVPPSEGQLLPPPFDGGANGSPLFPSPPLEGKALYGVSTWSLGSDLGGGGSGGGGGCANDAALKSSALHHRGHKPAPAESFSYHGGGMKTDVKNVKGGDHLYPQHQQQQQQQQQQRGTKTSFFRREKSSVNGSASVAATNATAGRGNPLTRRGRFLVQKGHTRTQRPKRAADVGEEQDEAGRNIASFNGSISISNSISSNHKIEVGGIATSGSTTVGVRRRSSGKGGGGGGGHQKRHREWLDKFGEDKRMERQQEEAKGQRREAARRRTRDLLLERAKQRLLAIAAAASTATASASSAVATGEGVGVSSSPQAGTDFVVDGCSRMIQGDPPAIGGESGDGEDVKGRGVVAAAASAPSREGGGGVGTAAAVAAVAAAAALSAGLPLYAQDTWAARHSKIERKGNEDDVTPEEKERLEKENFDRIAATRRRQKEHHKRFLAALKAKRVQEEEDRLVHERKEAEKRCNIKMWAERRLQKTQKASGEHCPSTDVVPTRKETEGGGGGDVSEEGSGGDAGNGGVAGSGLNAIRKAHSRSEGQEAGVSPEETSSAAAAQAENGCCFFPLSPATATPHITTSEEIEKAAKVADGVDKEERRRRFLEIKLAKEKAQRHLESLVQKKREKEDEEFNAKRRQAKRMKLLRDKVLSMARELRHDRKAGEAAQHPGAGAESSEEERGPGGSNNNNTNNTNHLVDGGTTAGSKAPSRLTDEELQASVERLTQQRKGGGVVTASARDFNDWKRKHRVAPETKVFVMTGWYPCVKKALIERGWVQNTDRDSPFFDLKWTLHSQDIRTTDIEPWQLCNHFFKNVAITTKAGLLGNLRNLKWFADCDSGDILPRGYDLSVETDVLAFLDDYCATAAESLLKHVLLRAKGRVALRRVGSSASSGQRQGPHAVSDTADSKSEEGDTDHGDGDSEGGGDEVMCCLENGGKNEAPVSRGDAAGTPLSAVGREGQNGDDDGDDDFDDSSEEEEGQGKHPANPCEGETRPSSSTPAPGVRTCSPIRDGVMGHAQNPAVRASSAGVRGRKAAASAAAVVVPPTALACSGTEPRAAGDQTVDLAAAAAAFSTPAIVPTLSVAINAAETATSATATPPGESSTLTDREEGSLRHQQQQREGRQQQQSPGVLETPAATNPTAAAATATAQESPPTAGAPSSTVEERVGGDFSPGQRGSAARVSAGAGGDGVQSSRIGKPRRKVPPISARRRQWEPEGAGIHVNTEILGAALAVCRRRHAPVGQDEGELDSGGPAEVLCSELEWELIGLGTGGGAPHPDMPGLYRPHCLPSRPATPLEAFIQPQPAEKDNKQVSSRGGNREERRRQKQQEDARAACAERVRTVVPLGGALLEQVEAVLERAATASRSQFDLNGDFCQNMWIVKPAAKSRGRGIECFTELDKLLSYTESKHPQAVSQWVVHKYIENPLIIARRKFDMRQWVLVTDWNPLTIWFYDRCYVRFGVEEYTTSGSNIGNNFVHLVNNSICKKSDNFGQVSTTDNGIEVHEHMWSNEVFTAYVDEVAGEGCWRKKMQPRMEQIVTWSLLCAQDLVEHRKNSWELYGYDFMVDDQHKPWLIEINSSPACDYSTKVTEQYVQAALTDLLKVTVDLPAWEANHKKSGRASHSQHKSGQQQEAGASAPAAAADDTVIPEEHHQQEPPAELYGVAMATPIPSQQGKQEAASSSPGENRGNASGSSREGSTTTSRAGSADISGAADKEELPGDGRRAETEARERRGSPPDTGLWRLLYKGAFVPVPVASFGTDLALKGTRIPNGKQRLRSSPHTVKL